MSIKSIAVKATYCFGESPLRLDDLKKVNFIFAPNGAGKSTISNMLARQPQDPLEMAAWDVAPTTLPIRVFNEAYRSRVLTENVNGIFTIGLDSKAISDKIQVLDRENRVRLGERDDWLEEIGSTSEKNQQSGLLGKIEDARIEARDQIFSAHKNLDASIIPIVFEGFRGSRDKFIEEACKRFSGLTSLHSAVEWTSMIKRATSLSGDQDIRPRLPIPSTSTLISTNEIKEIGLATTHGGGGKFTKLIEHLGNEDWVSGGRAYIDEARGQCPFCQNQAPSNLAAELAQYFEGAFDASLQRSLSIEYSAKSRASKLEVELCALETALRGDSRIVTEIFASSISGVRVAATLLLSRLAERSMHPTQPIKVSDVDVLMANLLELIEVENEKIGQHNQIVIDAGTERGRLVDDGWAMFLSDTAVSRHIRKLSGIEASSRRTIVDRKAAIAASEKQVEIANQDISKLRDSISNTAAVAERINKLLKAMGFHRFSLGSADDPHGGYRIVREDGTPAFHSLSEGEKSFICFAYLWESLFGTLLAGGAPEDVVPVIDDPISSLDSDALFMIAAYIRDAANQVKKGTSNLRQLIVLTHNTQFHHEAAYVANSGSKERRYFRLVKDLNGVTSVRDDGTHSQIRGSYASLWHSVVDAARNEGE